MAGPVTAKNLENALWRFALDRHRRTGVEETCLDLQDTLGADVCVVLYCLWRGQAGMPVGNADLIAIATGEIGAWHRDVVRPLRSARRAMKRTPGSLDAGEVEAERSRVKAAELGTEKLEIAMLAILAGETADAAVDRERRIAIAEANLAAYLASLGAADAVSGSRSLVRTCID